MIHSFKDHLPFAEHGFGLEFNHYVSGRIAADVVRHGGISTLYYVGKQGFRRAAVLTASQESAFAKAGRIQLLVDGRSYYLEFNQTTHYPFGYRSECELAGVRIRHEFLLERNTLYQVVRVLDNPAGHDVRARALLHGHVFTALPGRKTDPWTILTDGSMKTEIHDPSGSLLLRFLCSVPCSTLSRHEPFKYYMETKEKGELFVFAFQFDSEERPDFASAADRIDRWEQRFREGVRFHTGSEALDSALDNAVPTLESLIVPDRPGAIRASQSYWIWGWDSMVHAEALLWSGNADIVRDMLAFYRETADPVRGIVHCMDDAFRPDTCMAPCSQGLYIVMLANYCAATGDLDTGRTHYPFARWILELAGRNVHPSCSLGTAIGFFPDFPGLLDQKDSDVSLINNSLYLQALKSIAALEQAFGMEAEAQEHLRSADRLQKDMERFLWDDNAGYWCDSADGATLQPRRYYPLYGQLHTSAFGCDPHAESLPRIADFLKRHFRFDFGLYMFPPDNPAFMADGNQLGAYYPPVDRYYWNLMNRVGDTESAADFRRIIEFYWQFHAYPEGMTHETENADPTIDNPGCKQAFSMKGWFCDALELYFGLQVRMEGIRLHPLKTDHRIRVEHLILRGRCFSLETLPGGGMLLNGIPVPAEELSWETLEHWNGTSGNGAPDPEKQDR